MVPALGLLVSACVVFIVLAGALAVRLKPAPTVALVSSAVLSSFVWPVRAILPAIQRYWLVDDLAFGATLAMDEVGLSFLGAVLLTVFWLLAGSVLLQGRELP